MPEVVADVRPSTAADGDDRARVLALLERFGWNAVGFQALERGFRHHFDGDDACVSYVDTGRAWVVAGAPIASPERLGVVAVRVAEAARAAGRRICFFGVERRFLEATGMPALLVGDQATWDPREWSEMLSRRRSLREQLRRARAKGLRVREVSPEEARDPDSRSRREIEALVARWQAAHELPAMGFLVDVQLFDFPERRRYYVAERDEHVVGFLGAVPVFARDGWLFEDFLRSPDAPNGTMELLVDHAMRAAAKEGATYVTLGLSPLAGPVAAWLARARRWSSALYDFDGVRSFKEKLTPGEWDPIFLAYPVDGSALAAVADVLTAFAHGSLARFGLKSLLRGPRVLLGGLLVLLVPWTMALALSDGAWFPSVLVQRAWVAFDVALAVGLALLLRRWSTRLGVLLAAAVTVDAIVTVAEALLYRGPRGGWAALLVGAVACAGPALGAVALWGAVGRRRRAGAHRRASSTG